MVNNKRRQMANLSEMDKNHKCTVITAANYKGGCCKTTTCFALANYLFEENYRVLVVDTDPQGSLSKNFNVFGGMAEYRGNTLSSVYRDLDEISYKTFNAPVIVRGNLDNDASAAILLLPGDINLLPTVRYAEAICSKGQTCREKFAQLIDSYKDYFDYIIFDTTPVIEESICGVHALSVSDCVVIPIDAIEAVDNAYWTMEVITRNCKESVKVLFAFMKYKADDLHLTEMFEAQCAKRGLQICDEAVKVKSVRRVHGHNERKNTIYRFMRKVLPYNTCVTGIPEEQRINNSTYTSVDKKYKALYDDLCLEIKRKTKDGVEDDLCTGNVWNDKLVELKEYASIIRDYKTKNTPKKLNKVCFLDTKLDMFEAE
ncbi:MAG: ParA family protein [Clostridia bacterium]|jgi:cellulose biosynthesis protein BcsQ|nr:ParA family protein [Clostridia bacterium]